MPVYSYECKSCHSRFEVKQSFSDEPIKVCPECQGEVRRIIYPVGIVFKGSGFYATDNRNAGSTLKGAEETPSSSGDDSGKAEKEVPAAAGAGEKKSDP